MSSQEYHFLVFILAMMSLIVLIGGLQVLKRRQRRYQQIRQELVQWRTLHPREEPAVIAPLAQPQPDRVAAITLPTQIRLRTRWTQLLVPAICVIGAIDLAFLVPLYGSGWYQDLLILTFFDLIILTPLWGAVGILVIPQQITITKTGISVIQEGAPAATMTWREIKVLAVAPVGPAGDEPLYYDLSSTRKTIRLLRLRRQMRWFLFPWNVDRAVKPATSFEVYDAQMDALLSLLAAKTGLPLYDLRAV